MSHRPSSTTSSVINSDTDTKCRCMKFLSYGQNLVQSLDTLRKNDELCDFTVSAGGKSFKVCERNTSDVYVLILFVYKYCLFICFK